ncbi:hypothetical protein [Streptomyces fagopyri]
MSRRLHARVQRLERGTPAAHALGAEVMRLVDEFLTAGGDLADIAPLFGLGEGEGQR